MSSTSRGAADRTESREISVKEWLWAEVMTLSASIVMNGYMRTPCRTVSLLVSKLEQYADATPEPRRSGVEKLDVVCVSRDE
jgi:hypothetical protein